MASLQEVFAKTAMQQLAATELNASLADIFARILSRQIILDEQGNPQGSGAFDTLLQVFTFVATPANERPASPLQYGQERLGTALELARQQITDGVPEQEPVPESFELRFASESNNLVGEAGVQDFFIVEMRSDALGAFADFGKVNLSGFNQMEGDRLIFVDQNNLWSQVSQVQLADLQPNEGNARLVFNNDPGVSSPGQLQQLTLNGIETTRPFGNTLEDLQGIAVEVITGEGLDMAGSWQAYLEGQGWLA